MNSRKKQLKPTTSKSFKNTLHFTSQALEFPIEMFNFVTGVFLSNENTIRPAIDLLVVVLREASRDQ